MIPFLKMWERWLSLEFDEDFDTIAHPYKNRSKRLPTETGDWKQVKQTKMKTLKIKDDEEIEWKVNKNPTQRERNPAITEADKAIIKRRGLKLDKYSRIKTLWAEGKGIITISKEITDSGFSETTVKRYIKHINAANPSPSTAERGTVTEGQ